MKKLNKSEASNISGGALYAGNKYVAGGVTFSCAHTCKYQRQHKVTGNQKNGYVVSHLCVNA